MLSVVNASNIDTPEAVSITDIKTNETDSFASVISITSEEVSSQLHLGIIKTARRVVLDEVIGNVIAEFVKEKKAMRHLKHESVNQFATCPLDVGMVMPFTTLEDYGCLFIFIILEATTFFDREFACRTVLLLCARLPILTMLLTRSVVAVIYNLQR